MLVVEVMSTTEAPSLEQRGKWNVGVKVGRIKVKTLFQKMTYNFPQSQSSMVNSGY